MQRVGRVGAFVVGFIGAAVVVGWYLRFPVLTMALPGLVPTKPNAAVALIAAALAVAMLDRRRWAVALGAFTVALGAVTLVEYLFELSLGVDVLLPGIHLDDHSARMAPSTAVAIMLLGSAVIAGRLAREMLMRGLALAALAVGHIAVLGYAYGVSSLYSVGGFTSMAVATALCVQVLSLSILLLDPSAALVGLLRDLGNAGRLVRLMLPFLVIGSSALGWLSLWGQSQGFFDARFGVSVLVIGMTVLGCGLTWRVTVSMRELDRHRDASVQFLAQANQTLELAVAERTREAFRRQGFLDAVLAATPDYTFVTDCVSGAVLYGAPGKTILGLTSDELKSLGPESGNLIHPEDEPRLAAITAAVAGLPDGEVLQMLYRAADTDGQWRWLSRRTTPFRRDPTGTVVEILAVTRDVTDVVDAEDHLRHVALHDSLTGLPNRVLLVDRLDTALARSVRDGSEVAVLYCDLDGFKRVNDTAGHAAGDGVLVETARRMQSVLRPDDTVARVGGDEFVIALAPWIRAGAAPAPRGEQVLCLDAVDNIRDLALRVAERIIEVCGKPIEVNGVEHIVTASIGIAFAKARAGRAGLAETVSSNQVLQDADAAMYKAKGRGKDRFEVFEYALRTDLAERGRVEQVLRQALRQGGEYSTATPASSRSQGLPLLAVAYQPVFCSGTGALIGFEALARLTDAQGVNIPPEVFISVAEDVGIIRPLGNIILDLACEQLATWRAHTPGLQKVTMAVNLSALQAQHSSFVADVRAALSAHGLAGSDLVLELTETALLSAAHSTNTALRALHSEGVGIAIDDFGTGYASLRYLATQPVTSVKVDRSFVARLPHDETSRKIVKAVAGLAADMDLTCVVEGVETEAQRVALPAGVQIQGWLTGPPQPPHELDLLSLVTLGAPHIPHRDEITA